MEDFERELESRTQTGIMTETNQETEINLGSSFNFEEMLKSEKEVKQETTLNNLKKAEQTELVSDRVFAQPGETRRTLVKRRLKLITGMYVGVLTLLLVFTGVNLGTLVAMKKEISNNTQTLEKQQVALEYEKKNAEDIVDANEEINIMLNLPKDYSEDEKELTFLDKLTIMFKHLFG